MAGLVERNSRLFHEQQKKEARLEDVWEACISEGLILWQTNRFLQTIKASDPRSLKKEDNNIQESIRYILRRITACGFEQFIPRTPHALSPAPEKAA
jgi:hypothetical protein